MLLMHTSIERFRGLRFNIPGWNTGVNSNICCLLLLSSLIRTRSVTRAEILFHTHSFASRLSYVRTVRRPMFVLSQELKTTVLYLNVRFQRSAIYRRLWDFSKICAVQDIFVQKWHIQERLLLPARQNINACLQFRGFDLICESNHVL